MTETKKVPTRKLFLDPDVKRLLPVIVATCNGNEDVRATVIRNALESVAYRRRSYLYHHLMDRVKIEIRKAKSNQARTGQPTESVHPEWWTPDYVAFLVQDATRLMEQCGELSDP